jgi:hypothetical protein
LESSAGVQVFEQVYQTGQVEAGTVARDEVEFYQVGTDIVFRRRADSEEADIDYH